jgi:hypothetical protein
MSNALLDPRPGTAVDHVAELHTLIDQLQATPVGPTGHAKQVAEVDRAIHRLTAYRLKVLASADKARVAADAGFADTNAWAARQTRTSRATAARDVALAADLEHGHDATAAALDEGLLSPAHAAVIVHASGQLPTGTSDDQRATVEAALVEKAQRFDPDQLRRVARRAIETIEPDQATVDAHENDVVATEEENARSKSSLSLHDNPDGTTTGHFTVPTTAVAFLRKILDSMTAPRRMKVSTSSTGPVAPWDWNHRRGLAFAQLLEHLPTKHLHTRTAATVVVTIDHTVLTGALKTARLDTGEQISAGEARRIACGAGILPAVLSAGSVALDLGRESRLFSEAQRIALGLSHDTCAADGCQRAFAWCELHHRQPWSHGGRTDLRDAVPLCHWHHQRIHDHAYHHTWMPDGSIRFTRQT